MRDLEKRWSEAGAVCFALASCVPFFAARCLLLLVQNNGSQEVQWSPHFVPTGRSPGRAARWMRPAEPTRETATYLLQTVREAATQTASHHRP